MSKQPVSDICVEFTLCRLTVLFLARRSLPKLVGSQNPQQEIEKVFAVICANVFDRTLSLWTDDKHRPKRGTRTLDKIHSRDFWARIARTGNMVVNGLSPAQSVEGLRERVANDRNPDADRYTFAGLAGALLHFGRALECMSLDAAKRLPATNRAPNEQLPEEQRSKDLSLVRAHVEKDLSEALYWPEDLVQKLLGEPGSAKLEPDNIKSFIPQLTWVSCEPKPDGREWTALLWPKIGDHVAQSVPEALSRSFVSRRSPAQDAPPASRNRSPVKIVRVAKRSASPESDEGMKSQESGPKRIRQASSKRG